MKKTPFFKLPSLMCLCLAGVLATLVMVPTSGTQSKFVWQEQVVFQLDILPAAVPAAEEELEILDLPTDVLGEETPSAEAEPSDGSADGVQPMEPETLPSSTEPTEPIQPEELEEPSTPTEAETSPSSEEPTEPMQPEEQEKLSTMPVESDKDTQLVESEPAETVNGSEPVAEEVPTLSTENTP